MRTFNGLLRSEVTLSRMATAVGDSGVSRRERGYGVHYSLAWVSKSGRGPCASPEWVYHNKTDTLLLLDVRQSALRD